MALPSVAIETTLWNVVMLLGALLGVVVSGMFLRRGRRRMNVILAVLVSTGSLWSVTNVLSRSVTDPASAQFWTSAEYVWIPTVSVAWLIFGLEYSEYGEYVNWKTLAVLAFHPATVATAAFTNQTHHLFWLAGGSSNGPIWIAHAVVSYVELLAGTALILRYLYRDESIYVKQASVLAIGVLFPMTLNALYLIPPALGTSLFENDPTPMGFAVTGLAFFVGMRSFDLGDVTPIAKSVVVDNLNDGLIIVDDDERITEINEEAKEMLRIRDAEVGQHLADALDHAPEVAELGRAEDRIHVEADVELPSSPGEDLAADGGSGERRTFDFEVTPVRGKRGTIAGRLYQFRDVTDRVERERELELQNQQLDNFVAAISREIRDPMEDLDEQINWAFEHAPETEQQLRRVLFASTQTTENITRTLDELVTLARDQSVVREEDMVQVSLEDAADHAWWEVTGREGEPSLEVHPSVNVYADRDRLQRVFENLFDNAVLHGGDDVDIEVGLVRDAEGNRDGFYVEDDGPGFRATDDDPFAPGVTTAEDRPGIGLSVVTTAAEAHGWDVARTDATDGGARVEVTDVDFPNSHLSDRVSTLAGQDRVVDDPNLSAD